MINVIGAITREVTIFSEREAVKNSLLVHISRMQLIEKGLSYYNGFEILSTSKIPLDIFRRPKFNCFCTLIESEENTTIKIKVKTYWYMEAVLIILGFVFVGGGIYYQVEPTLFKAQSQFTANISFFIVIILCAAMFYQNFLDKKEGVVIIDRLIEHVQKDFTK